MGSSVLELDEKGKAANEIRNIIEEIIACDAEYEKYGFSGSEEYLKTAV
jgi:hypothetical protein